MKSAVYKFAGRVERFLSSASGVTATEYAILIALIVLTALAAIVGIGVAVEGSFGAAYERVVDVLYRSDPAYWSSR
ncbi:MAG: Flp family type IVb pilin [Phycisphaerae bacterium]|jgi:Flp pilus assembly pilin Flp